MGEAAPLWPAALLAVAGIAVLRLAWSRAARSAALNAAGWGLLLASWVAGALAGGAWGIAVASLFAMGAAALALAQAAVASPAKRGRAAASRRVKMLPEAGEPLRLGGRLATFAIVALGGLAASLAMGVGLRGLAVLGGWSEAGANALALFAVPLGWGVLGFVLLMQHRRRSQFATLAGCAALCLLALLPGA